MLPLLLVGIVTAICSAKNPPERTDNGYFLRYGHGRYALAVDINRNSLISPDVFECLRAQGYKKVFFQVYDARVSRARELPNFPAPSVRAREFPNAVLNIREAIRAGLGVEVYMTPRCHRNLNESVQMAEVINYFNSSRLGTRRIWVQVKAPEWDPVEDKYTVDCLEDLISTAKGHGIDIGIYTNEKNWNKINNSWRLKGHHLWYKNVREAGATPVKFVPFGNWERPTVQQFARKQLICGIRMNQDVYDVHLMESYRTN